MTKKTIIFSILAATAVGALAGILLAPDKGSKTRKKMFKKSRKAADGIRTNLNDFVDSVADKFSNAAGEVSQKFDKAKATASNGK